jgi:hypothetical protein
VVPATSSYSKDDFFDQLSCDTLERLADGGDRDAWRSKMAAQRRVDVETFGGTARAGALRAALSSLFTPDSKPGAARGKRSGPSAGTRHAVPCR